MAQRAYIERPFELKKVSSDGTFEGVASPFGEVDSYRDIVMPGAFKDSLAFYEAKNRKVPMLWQHNQRQPIGVYTSVKEAADQLLVVGECNMDVQQGRECHSLMKQGALTGLSIGYDTEVEEWDKANLVRKLHKVKLYEISPVTFPAADSARVTLVKSLEEAGNLSDCEAILRDAGFSRAEATAFTARVKALSAQSESADATAKAVRNALHLIHNS